MTVINPQEEKHPAQEPAPWDDERLTIDPEKRSLYAWDPYCRDCVDDLQTLTVDQKTRLLYEHVPLILRPDALLTGQFRHVLRTVARAGFEAVHVESFVFDRFRVRECWKYQMNTATRERLDVFDMMLVGWPAAYILWRRPVMQARSACEQLNDLKGASDPTKRRPGDLRFAVDKVQLSVFTYIHVPDEPIDFLRELGAFFDRGERLALVDRALHAAPMDPSAAVEAIAARIGSHSLTAQAAWASLVESSPDASVQRQVQVLQTAWQDNPHRWREIYRELEVVRPGLNHWDAVAICAASATTHDPGRAPVIAPKYAHVK